MANELMNISAEIHQEINKAKTSWIRLGELLDQARKKHGENDKAFGKWCDEQGFEIGKSQLWNYRTAWLQYSAIDHDRQEKLDDLISWRRIAALNHVQKPRVLKKLEQAEGKVTRRDVVLWIDQTRTQAKPAKDQPMNKAEAEKALKRAKARESTAEKTQQYYDSMVREFRDLINSDDYKLIRSCLHSDREAEPERKNRAFAAFQKLNETVEATVVQVFGKST